MNKICLVFLTACILGFASCRTTVPAFSTDENILESLMKSEPKNFDSVLAHRKDWNVQVIYTQVNRQKNGQVLLKDFYFNVDKDRFFYPASTVKLPIALMALEKLNDLKIEGLNRKSIMITDSAYSKETVVYNDPTAVTGAPAIEHYIKKIFLVSDNDAANRLYEFLGSETINNRLHEMGYTEAQILHRLAIFNLSQDENRHTNPVRFFDEKGNLLYAKPLLFDKQSYETRNDFLGRGYITGGALTGDSLVNRPMNFSLKNRIALSSLHNILKSVYFPEAIPLTQRFRLTADDYRFVKQYMSQFPSETKYPPYDTAEYPDAYCKFLFYGSGKGSLPKNPRLFNKVGDAYGNLLDIAYFVDFEKGVEFMLSAVIYCNADGILNDDQYDYDRIGYPFLENIGRLINNYESTKRKRRYKPGFADLKFNYDK
jgi:hypothetical protein